MTLWRWDHDPNLKFPKPVRIRGRKYRDEAELDAFDAAQARDAETWHHRHLHQGVANDA